MTIGDRIGIAYSKTTKETYEKYCRENLLMDNGTEREKRQYNKERKQKEVCLVIWIMMWVFIVIKTICVMAERYRYVPLSVIEMGIVVAVVTVGYVLFKMGMKVINRTFPMCRQIEKEADFKMTVEVYFYPLMELQEEFKAGFVKRIYVNVAKNILTVDLDKQTGKERKEFYLYGGYKDYIKNGCLDFTCIDEFISDKAECLRGN